MEKQKTYYSPENFSGNFKNGIFTSQIFDSGKAETKWDRLKLEIPRQNKIEVCVYIFEDTQNIPKNPSIVSRFTDILLYNGGINGRYLCFEVKLLENEANFTAYELSFPKQSFVEYLPEIYHGNEQLERFLAVYQNQYLDAEDEIMNFHNRLNLQKTDAPEKFAPVICGEIFLGLPENRLRKLLGVSSLLYRIKGTKNCIKLLIYALTGKFPIIIDCADDLSESEKRLFVTEDGHFYLLLKSRPDIDLDLFHYLIKQFIPITSFYTTIFLDENKCMGNYCFIGKNHISDKKHLVVNASVLGGDLRL